MDSAHPALPAGWVERLYVSPSCDKAAVAALRKDLNSSGAHPLIAFADAGALSVVGDPATLDRVATRHGFRAAEQTEPLTGGTGSCSQKMARAVAAWRKTREVVTQAGDAKRAAVATSPGVEERSDPGLDPLVGDAFYAPTSVKSQTGSMQGDFGIVLITPESNGGVDGNTENWTESDYDKAYNEVLAGLTWWTSYAATFSVTLNFTLIDFDFGSPLFDTDYEPITHNSEDICTWISDVMDNFGYGSGNCFTGVDNFDTAKELEYGVDHVITVFVVNSVNDADGKFPDGYFAFSFFGGPQLVMTTDNGNWGIDLMDAVLSHEITHSFWACDEYAQPGYFVCDCSCPDSPFNTDNSNCENSCGPSVDCLMKNNTQTVCEHTRNQIGWGAVTTTTTTTPSTTTTTNAGDDDTDDDAGDDDTGDDDGGDDGGGDNADPPIIDDDSGGDDDSGSSGLRPTKSDSGSCGC